MLTRKIVMGEVSGMLDMMPKDDNVAVFFFFSLLLLHQ
jgi:hypothetical protein